MDKAAAALARMKGPVVPLNLCFDESGALDHQAVAAYVDWLSAQGAPISDVDLRQQRIRLSRRRGYMGRDRDGGPSLRRPGLLHRRYGFLEGGEDAGLSSPCPSCRDGRGQSPSPSLSGQYHAGPNQLLQRLGRGRRHPPATVGRWPAPLPLGSRRGTSPAPPHHWHEERRRPILHVFTT